MSPLLKAPRVQTGGLLLLLLLAQGRAGHERTPQKNSAMSAFDPSPTGLSVRADFAVRKQGVADLDLMGEFATQKLIDKPGNFCLMVEEMTERSPVKNERSYDALSGHCGCGRPFS